GLESERLPRPGAELPMEFALLSFEGKLRAAGVTTVFHGAGFEESMGRGTPRTIAGAVLSCDTIEARTQGLVDHRILYRLDVRSAEGLVALKDRLNGRTDMPLVSHEDHTPGQGQYTERAYYERYMIGSRGMTAEEAARHVDDLIAERSGRLGIRE